MNDMLYDVTNIELVSYPANFERQLLNAHRENLSKLSVNILNLGYFGTGFMDYRRLRFDENFYDQAGVDFQERWSGFKYERNFRAEDELFMTLGCDREPYVFLHEDASRNFLVDRNFLPKNMKIVEPKFSDPNSRFFNYQKVIENATEIHVIESSFCAYIESLNLGVKKFAHRYARPEASQDYCHEFTYRSDWMVYL